MGKIFDQNNKSIYYNSNYEQTFYIRTALNNNRNNNGYDRHGRDLEAASSDSTGSADHFFISLRPFLIFGKVIGLLPFSGVFNGNSSNDLTFKKGSITSIVTYAILTVSSFNAIFGAIASFNAPKRNALEIAESIRATLYFVWGCAIFVTFIVRGNQFLEIFKCWNATETVFGRRDSNLKRDSLFICGLIFTSAILENATLHLEYIKELDSIVGNRNANKTKNMTSLETFYWRGSPHWAKLLGYNWFFAVLSFLQHKWILYSWNYMDVCIAIFGRAMYFRFKSLNEEAEEKLLQKRGMLALTNNDKNGMLNDRSAWLQVVHDHEELCRLLEVLERFFSPMIFASYAINMFYICLQLLDGLTSEVTRHSEVHSVYAPWSFVHLVMRLFIVSICCARINVYAHKIRFVFQDCPVEFYNKEISRIDKRITSGPDIGLTGLQAFVVTKRFILSILSVIFTLEIVLLQCVPPPPPKLPRLDVVVAAAAAGTDGSKKLS